MDNLIIFTCIASNINTIITVICFDRKVVDELIL